MEQYQQRVVTEKAELDEKLKKLCGFIKSGMFTKLDRGEQGRLKLQRDLMWQYSEVLGERIAAFKS